MKETTFIPWPMAKKSCCCYRDKYHLFLLIKLHFSFCFCQSNRNFIKTICWTVSKIELLRRSLLNDHKIITHKCMCVCSSNYRKYNYWGIKHIKSGTIYWRFFYINYSVNVCTCHMNYDSCSCCCCYFPYSISIIIVITVFPCVKSSSFEARQQLDLEAHSAMNQWKNNLAGCLAIHIRTHM